jgi:hypothetical protein
LEIELNEIKASQPPSELDALNIAVDALSSRLADTIGNPGGLLQTKPKHKDDLPLISRVFLSQAPAPPFGNGLESPSSFDPTWQSTNIALVPRHVIDILLKNYCSIYLLQYPAVEEAKLYASCNRIFSNDSPSHYDVFTVAITLAISVNIPIQF